MMPNREFSQWLNSGPFPYRRRLRRLLGMSYSVTRLRQLVLPPVSFRYLLNDQYFLPMLPVPLWPDSVPHYLEVGAKSESPLSQWVSNQALLERGYQRHLLVKENETVSKSATNEVKETATASESTSVSDAVRKLTASYVDYVDYMDLKVSEEQTASIEILKVGCGEERTASIETPTTRNHASDVVHQFTASDMNSPVGCGEERTASIDRPTTRTADWDNQHQVHDAVRRLTASYIGVAKPRQKMTPIILPSRHSITHVCQNLEEINNYPEVKNTQTASIETPTTRNHTSDVVHQFTASNMNSPVGCGEERTASIESPTTRTADWDNQHQVHDAVRRLTASYIGVAKPRQKMTPIILPSRHSITHARQNPEEINNYPEIKSTQIEPTLNRSVNQPLPSVVNQSSTQTWTTLPPAFWERHHLNRIHLYL